MDEVGSVRDAYSSMSHQYIGLFDGPAAGGQAHAGDESLIRRHLGGLAGPVFDLGCGPGHWSAYLHSLGDEVTGVDVVPEFIAHAQATHPGPTFRLGSMTALDVDEHSASGVLSWYSTIHLPPTKLDDTLAGIRRLLAPCGVLVIGFFDSDSDDEVAEFEHAVTTAYRWPFDVFNQHLAAAGFIELERLRFQVAERPNRKYAAIAARAS